VTVGWRVREGLWRVHLPRLPVPAMAPKRSASTSPEPSTSSSDASSDSSSDGEKLPAQQTTRSGRVSRPPNRHVPSPGKLLSDATEEYAARRASGEAAAAKRQRAAERALRTGAGAAAVAAVTVVSLWLLTISAIDALTAVDTSQLHQCRWRHAAGQCLAHWPDGQQLPQHGRRSSRQRRARLLAVQPRPPRRRQGPAGRQHPIRPGAQSH
jgi:hypothetical protein